MSGTLAHSRRQTAERLQRRADSRNAAAKHEKLLANREAVKAAVLKALNWNSLEPFAENMLDRALAGDMVDVKQLTADLADWQSRQKAETQNDELS